MEDLKNSSDTTEMRIIGYSVTRKVRATKQPKGGYINPTKFTAVPLTDTNILNLNENIVPTLIGIVVDYLTRFMTGTSVEESFRISMMGANRIGENTNVQKLISEIKGLDNLSIINAVKMTGYDIIFREGPKWYKPVDEINADVPTIENVRIMVNRSLKFFEQYGPKVLNGFTFRGGYTRFVSTGDGDFTTADTLWDFKVSKYSPEKNHTLQLLMYWRMGLHSIHPEFQNIKYLGIYNPRLNIVYRIATSEISDEVIFEVEKNVIGYDM